MTKLGRSAFVRGCPRSQNETILTANGKNVISKAWDNRFGVLMVTELLESLSGHALPNQLIAGANVQEEVGLRGAHASTTKFNPDIFLAVDCSPAGDIYGDQGKLVTELCFVSMIQVTSC